MLIGKTNDDWSSCAKTANQRHQRLARRLFAPPVLLGLDLEPEARLALNVGMS